MKPGTYRVTVDVELSETLTKEEAIQSVVAMIVEMDENNVAPQMEFELLKEFELDYILEEDDEVRELEF